MNDEELENERSDAYLDGSLKMYDYSKNKRQEEKKENKLDSDLCVHEQYYSLCPICCSWG